MVTNEELLEKAESFLKDSASFFNTQRDRMDRDWQVYSGNFWDDDTVKEWKRLKRPHEAWNISKVFVNAISSPFSSSPYHIQLEKRDTPETEDAQEMIDGIEADSDSKNAILDSIANAAVAGEGYLTVSIIDETDQIQRTVLEVIDDPKLVAMDPSINTTSGVDAEEGAIVNMMSLNKAKRLYGEEIIGMGFPKTMPGLFTTGIGNASETQVPVINYYYKDDDGKVVFSKLCGFKVIEHKKMPYDIIPIIRFTGYKTKGADRKTQYLGVVRATWGLQIGANVGYSTLLERLNRSPKGSFLINMDGITNLEDYYKIVGDEESLFYPYNGQIPPTPIKESFETGDLVNTINQSLQLMSNVLGIPLTGIEGLNLKDKTATEVLVQQTNSESNVACFYTSAYNAIRHLGKVLIGLNNLDTHSTVFSIQNGPNVITQNAKKRQELSLLTTLLPENMKPLIAKYMADTLDDSMAKDLGADILANLDPSIKVVSDKPEDPNAVHILNGMKQTLDQSMQELTKAKTENAELKQQLAVMNLQILNMKTQQALDFKKFQIEQENKMHLEEAKLMAQGVKIDNDAKAQSDKTMIEAEKLSLEAQKAKAEALSKLEEDQNVL